MARIVTKTPQYRCLYGRDVPALFWQRVAGLVVGGRAFDKPRTGAHPISGAEQTIANGRRNKPRRIRILPRGRTRLSVGCQMRETDDTVKKSSCQVHFRRN